MESETLAEAAQLAEGPPPIRWGILATGGIARMFTRDLRHLPDARVVAVGSRSAAGAEAFGHEFGIAHRHGSYQALVEDPEVDVVYIATPHPGHHEAALQAIAAGKAVLLEKPFAMDALQTNDIIEAAAAANVFVMEAMWTRWLPHIVRVREIVASGVLGEIVSVTADHGQWFRHDPNFRLFKHELGGGALLDLGIYPISFASMILGAPSRVTAVSAPAFSGVDAQTSMILEYPGVAQAILTTTSYAVTPCAAVISGTQARLEIEGIFYQPSTFKVIGRDGAELDRWDAIPPGRGMQFEAAEVQRCLRAGLLESPDLPLRESLQIMQTMDEVRRQIGLTY
ncbi:predicted dehydrogenase [Jatrophihabitans sp. GAS493]|uniref:Gfo/Idh/MocA family protein n=1 Tax=Jatrophihabitans sp. GAS493 TaxID=1907575 RepID=UPI000BB6E32D|nr:Gfo/Idh/MocA family oxidoreductase [Jatrophihabitans sp. GAS493]SOD71449.1 predicted dehydrogenase [Jatrophihabitans sp. GAS493]